MINICNSKFMKKLFLTLDEKDQFIFLLETWMFISMIIAWAVIVNNNIKPTELSNSICFFYANGYFCPGCGGTRAVESLLYGHLLKSFLYHPIVLYTFLIYIISYVSYIVYFITRGNRFLFKLKMSHAMYGVSIIMIWFFIRNFLAFYFGYNIYNLLGLKA